jgi:hypothetical protein
MTERPVQIIEPATGDEICVRETLETISLAIRTEVGSWQQINLSPDTARSVAGSLDAAANRLAQRCGTGSP